MSHFLVLCRVPDYAEWCRWRTSASGLGRGATPHNDGASRKPNRVLDWRESGRVFDLPEGLPHLEVGFNPEKSGMVAFSSSNTALSVHEL